MKLKFKLMKVLFYGFPYPTNERLQMPYLKFHWNLSKDILAGILFVIYIMIQVYRFSI